MDRFEAKRVQKSQNQQQQQLPEADSPGNGKLGAKIDISKQLHKTKMCMHYLKGKCRYGPDCSYAHNEVELMHRPNLRKTRLCKNYEMGACDNPHCAFAHGGEELRGTDGVWKTVMCAKWLNGTCRAGSRCRFAHGQHELQVPPDEEDSTFDVLDDASGEAGSAPISPAFFPSMPMNGYAMPCLPYDDQSSSPSYNSMRSTQPDSLAAMVQMVQMISNLEAEKPESPSGVRTAPPPPPSKWQQVEDTQNVPAIPEDKMDNAQNVQVLKSTPKRNRPNRPLSPLSPTALNCLPSGLFSPGSLSVPKQLLGETSW